MAQVESDYSSLALTEEMRAQLENVVSSSSQVKDETIPTTLSEALQPSLEARVITEAVAPFKITNVNSAWENLCGYNKYECYGKTLNMIQGPETDMHIVAAMMNRLAKGELADGVLVNYTKDGKKFKNHLLLGPIFGDIDGSNSNEVTHFIGILKKIQDPVGRKVHV